MGKRVLRLRFATLRTNGETSLRGPISSPLEGTERYPCEILPYKSAGAHPVFPRPPTRSFPRPPIPSFPRKPHPVIPVKACPRGSGGGNPEILMKTPHYCPGFNDARPSFLSFREPFCHRLSCRLHLFFVFRCQWLFPPHDDMFEGVQYEEHLEPIPQDHLLAHLPLSLRSCLSVAEYHEVVVVPWQHALDGARFRFLGFWRVSCPFGGCQPR